LIEAKLAVLIALVGACVWAFCDFERTLRERLRDDQEDETVDVSELELDETLMLGCRYMSRRWV
jgi:hypothetical protein